MKEEEGKKAYQLKPLFYQCQNTALRRDFKGI